MRSPLLHLPLALFATTAVVAAQSTVIPATAANTAGGGALWAPGFAVPLRMQILVDEVHLASACGGTLRGLRLRRVAHDRAFDAGLAHWNVALSIAPHAAMAARTTFAANMGPAPVAVLQQTIAAPASPAPTLHGATWSPDDTVEVLFTQPFSYPGGTLCIDITGTPDPLQPSPSWPIDAVQAPLFGTVHDVGTGCGNHGAGTWAFTDASSMVAGATARFSAFGTPSALAFFVIATGTQQNALPLEILGGRPGCFGHLVGVIDHVPTAFSAPVFPADPSFGGMAAVQLQLPRLPWILGASFGDQWLDFGQPPFVSSNAHHWTVAASPPDLGMATVMARADHGTPANGEVLHTLAPVLHLLH